MGEIIRKVKEGRFLGWYIRYKDADGKRKQRASHQPTQALARRYLLEVEGRIARGMVGIPEPAPPAPTVAALIERFLSEYSRPRIKDLERYRTYARTALRRAIPFLGTMPADTVQSAELAKLRDTLGQRRAANSVRLTLAWLGVVYSWAVKEGIVPSSPLRGVERPVGRELVEYLSKEEVRALFAVAEQRAASALLVDRMRHACIHLALHAGLRKGELLGLRWRDIDLGTRRLTVARSYSRLPKGGKPRHLRLPDVVVPALTSWMRECPETAERLIFPVPYRGNYQMGSEHSMLGLPELLIEAGCRSLPRPWHALRHTFASHFVMNGGNILSLQKILGHADIKMTLVYAHLAPDFLGDEMNKVKY